MKRNFVKSTAILAGLCFIMGAVTSCKDDKDDDKMEAKMEVMMTDAPSDDNNVEAVFVTVAHVAVDGRLVDGFEKQTIEISAYSDGNTKTIFSDDVEVGSYSKFQMFLDTETDANGNSPGSYVVTKDGVKHSLKAGSENTINIEKSRNFEVTSSSSTQLVVDLDLRKAIKRKSPNSNDYEFVSDTELNSAVRVNEMSETGTIKGTFDGTIESDEKVVVFAYKKGTYTSSEANATTSSNLRYTNSMASAEVNSSGNYTLAFLEEGDYEIKAAKYRMNSENRIEFDSELNLQMWLNAVLSNSVKVSAQSDVVVNLTIL